MKNLLDAVLDSHVKSDIYPIFIRNSDKGHWKKIEVRAATYKKAINIACAKHLNKWLNFSLARKMDLISARVDAAKASKTTGKPSFIVLVKDEFIVTPTPAKNAELYAKFVGGSEDKQFIESLKSDDKVIETEPAAKPVSTVKAKPVKEAIKTNDNKMTTKTAKKVAKKAAKKVPAKKAVKKAGEAKKRSIYGFGIELLELLKKGGSHPMESLTKKFKVKNSNISFQIAAIKSNDYKVERTEKGYKLVK